MASLTLITPPDVWMTGFGNFSFFYLKADFGLVRVLQMLWRLNFLVLCLCWTQGTTYLLYYICLLHTYYFFVVYGTMRIGKEWNYTKWGIRVKLLVLALVIFVVWDVDSGIFALVHRPFFSETPVLGGTLGGLWEWYFRSTLDHWSTFYGMVFALNYPVVNLFFRKVEALSLAQHVAVKAVLGAAFAVAFYTWAMGPLRQEKFTYNQTNPYYGIVPLTAYIFFRNLTPWLRRHSMDLLHEVGKTTLETYLMQHHIWLTSNAKSLLILIPGWPKVNFLLVSILYVLVSRKLYRITLYLRGMLLPDDRSACLRNLGALVAILGAAWAVAFVLRAVGLLDLTSVGLGSVASGLLLYSAIVRRTGSANEAADPAVQASGPLIPASGALSVVLIGIVWQYAITHGAVKSGPLPSSCAAYIHGGSWVRFDSCTEDASGAAYREKSISAFGSCAPQGYQQAWGWEAAPASSHCRFAQRDSKSILKRLNGRRVVYVGDSVVRHLYHSMRRQVGDSAAGMYNTTMGKWSDYSNSYGKATLDFRWAPFANQTAHVLNQIAEEQTRPDLIVVGGGPWDRLHNFKLGNDRAHTEASIEDVATSMRQLKSTAVPLVWVVPTTINTLGLLTDEKRDNIREEQMESFRELYVDKGVLRAASFVLDGRRFTSSRVQESYDGVHYPLEVYDAGSQILANALDWLLPAENISDPFTPPRPGKMANYSLGLWTLALACIGLFLFDGFLGVSYLAACVAPTVLPYRLFNEAYTTLHSRMNLPPIPGVSHDPSPDSLDMGASHRSTKSKDSDSGDDDDESKPLVELKLV